MTLAVLAGAMLAACSSPTLGPARFAAEECHIVDLVEPITGTSIVGAEDLALSSDGQTLIVSAYDRLAVEAALEGNSLPPDGGIYGVPVQALKDRLAHPRPLVDYVSLGGLRPHGIAVDGDRLAIINRRAGETGTSAAIDVFSIEGYPAQWQASFESPELCAANDIAWQGDALLFTLDRQKCPGWAVDERVLGRPRAALMRQSLDPEIAFSEVVADKLFFANGLTTLPSGDILVAETRGRRLRLIAKDGTQSRIKAPGAPDNLSLSQEGAVAALQPNLIRFGQYRYGHRDKAPSRIAVWSQDAGWETLYNDETGDQFSGATVAILHDGMMVAGSVRAPGLLVCETGQSA